MGNKNLGQNIPKTSPDTQSTPRQRRRVQASPAQEFEADGANASTTAFNAGFTNSSPSSSQRTTEEPRTRPQRYTYHLKNPWPHTQWKWSGSPAKALMLWKTQASLERRYLALHPQFEAQLAGPSPTPGMRQDVEGPAHATPEVEDAPENSNDRPQDFPSKEEGSGASIPMVPFVLSHHLQDTATLTTPHVDDLAGHGITTTEAKGDVPGHESNVAADSNTMIEEVEQPPPPQQPSKGNAQPQGRIVPPKNS
ncbi:hypothetical protein DFH27DRAFT_606771 [Peziza echinospora]|nr:hypothetical protein DFH27DRAFT_606771 [Peziza echinospora]